MKKLIINSGTRIGMEFNPNQKFYVTKPSIMLRIVIRIRIMLKHLNIKL